MSKNFNGFSKLLLRFFRWYSHPKLRDHIEGDLVEVYAARFRKHGKSMASLALMIDVLMLFRPGIIRPVEGYKNLNNYGMVKSYFKIGWRNLLRGKGYSAINIAGLAVGMGVILLMGLWVQDEISFDTNHENYDRIAQVYEHQTSNGDVSTIPGAPMPLRSELKTNYNSDFKRVVMAWWESSHTLSIEAQKISSNGTFMDPEGLAMFSFKMISGSWSSLSDPASIVLSEPTAKALFGETDPINKMLRIDNMMDVRVTGVYEELPYNSQLHTLQFVSTWDLWLNTHDWMRADEHDWKVDACIFVELQPGISFESVSGKIKDTKFKHLPKADAVAENPQLFLHPMSRWHLYSEWKNGREAGGRIQFVWLFGLIGAFVLILACINFMNLSTAQSERRAREVGIRKSVGSVRGQLIYQFLSESFLVVMFAFVVAMILVSLLLPWFNLLADKRMTLPWTDTYFWLISLGFILITSLLSGSYPAFYLSSFQPVKVLKGTFKAGRFASVPRQILVVLQFCVSVALITGTIIVWQQIQFAKNRPIGYDRSGLIMIRKTSSDFWGKFNILKNELKASGAAAEVAESSSPATSVWFNNTGFSWKGKDPNLHDDFATMAVTHDFGRTMGWAFLQGRDYSREFSTDSSAVILNEAAVKFMSLKEPVNEEIIWNGKKLHVIGVIKNMIMTSPYEPVKQTIFWLGYEGNVWINIRMNPSMSSSEALVKIEKVFQSLFPAVPFEYKFTDQEYALKFSGEERIGRLASIFASLAIFISCMGLLGMASFVAEQRKKEIGIRKILGASVFNIWVKLSSEFVMLVVISCLVGLPIAWYFLTEWLQRFEYHTNLPAWIFAAACFGTVGLTIVTVSYQTIRAALGNPVISLKSE